ncbi:conserved Plasmodium protein, unknown function [Plasmodium gaboni]|uniref:Heptatricopeptide repeat-containing protein n=1 Tax=Plasmodium gaboni TaxID=647221 RepID=A0ABY1USE5_9APIC|nr:conserved Plasmodium protein, unknown function [Plasmodium gaboni]
MYLFLAKRCFLVHNNIYRKIFLSSDFLKKLISIKCRSYSTLKSIYEYDYTIEENFPYDGLNKNVSDKEPSLLLSDYIKFDNDKKLKHILFTNNIEELIHHFEKNLNELKSHEYIFLLFKIYEIIFYNFYGYYEHSEIMKLENPNFIYNTFTQYMNKNLKDYSDKIESLDDECNDEIFFENIQRFNNDMGEQANEMNLERNDIYNINNNKNDAKENNNMNSPCITINTKCNENMTINTSYHGDKNILENIYTNMVNKKERKNDTIYKFIDENKVINSINDKENNNPNTYVTSANYPDTKENNTKEDNHIINIDINKFNIKILIKIYYDYIIYIEDLNIKEKCWKEYVSSFFLKNKKYEKLYCSILNTVYKKIYFFPCIDIINFWYIIKRINIYPIKDLSSLVINKLMENLKYLDEKYLVRLGYIYLNNSNKKRNHHFISSNHNNCNNKEFIDMYIHMIQNKVKNMNNNNFIKILEYVSNNNYKHIQFFKECKNEIYKRYNNFTQVQIFKLFYLYSQNINASDKLLMNDLLKSILQIFSKQNGYKHIHSDGEIRCDKKHTNDKKELPYELQDNNIITVPLSILLNALWTNAKYFKDFPLLLKYSEQVVLKNIKNFSSSTISMLIWAYSTVENKRREQIEFDQNIYVELKNKALEVFQNMTPKQLSNSLLGISTTIGRTIDNEGNVNTDFHDAVEKYLLDWEEKDENRRNRKRHKNNNKSDNKNYNEHDNNKKDYQNGEISTSFRNRNFLNFFTSEDLANICYSYALVRCGSKELHFLLQSCLLNKLYDLSPQHISKIAYTYGTFYFYSSYSLLSSLQYEILQRIHQFCHLELSDILWCYCVNKFFDSKFWKFVLQIINFDKIYDPRCALLYSSLSYMNIVDSSILESHNVLKIFNNLREYYWDLQICEYPHAFANEIVNALNKENEELLSKGVHNNMKISKRNDMHIDENLLNENLQSVYLPSQKLSSDNNHIQNENIPTFEYVKKLIDFEGFLVDIYFEYKNEKYAVFLYTPLNTTRDQYPLGENILKTRYMKKRKFKIIHLLYDVWREYNHKKINLIYSQL